MTLSEERELWETLLAHDAWKKLHQLMSEQAASRINHVVLTPLQSMDEALATEFMKGEVAALRLIMEMPGLEIERLKQDIQLKEQEDDSQI